MKPFQGKICYGDGKRPNVTSRSSSDEKARCKPAIPLQGGVGADRRICVKKRTACTIGITALVMCAAGGYGYYYPEKKNSQPESLAMPEGMALSEDCVSATGLTSVGMLEEICGLGFLEDGLYVEETCLSTGDEVEAGTAVFKVSEESLENARRELEKQVQETALNVRQGAITYETGLVEAQKEKELAAVEADYAQSVYDNAVAAAQSEVDALQKKVDEAQEKADEYTASIETDYYYTYYEVAEKEATWKDNAAFLMELYNEWNVEALEDIYGGSGGKNGIGYVTNQVSSSGASSSGASTAQGGSGTTAGLVFGVPSQSEAAGGSASGVNFSKESVAGVFFTQEIVDGENIETAETEESGAEGNATEESGGTEREEGGSGETDTSSGDESVDTENSGAETENPAGPETGNPGGENSGFGGGNGGFGGENGGFGGSVSGNDIRIGGSVNVGDDEIRYNIYLAMEEETEESEQAYEKALENYENAKELAAAGMAEAKSELAVLQAQLEEQQTVYEKAVISAKLAYDLAISGYENAQMVYESAVKQLEEEYEALKEEEETAAEHLELFEKTVGDGTFYTSSAGTVMMTMVRASQWITEDTVVIAYSNPDTVMIAANVDQADIASVEIGQEAFVMISGYGAYTGKVTSLNPVSSTGGSSVAYTVNVQLEGDISALEANLTAYVYLGLTKEEQEMMSGAAGGGR